MRTTATTTALLMSIALSNPAFAQAERCGLAFVDEAQMNERVANMDANADGTITRAEHETFLATLDLDADTRRRYIATFDLRDKNGDDVLTEPEIRAGIGAPLAD